MPNIQNFAQRGFGTGLPPGLQRPQAPNIPQQANFGGQFQPPAQQQITQSQILGQLLAGQLGNVQQDQGNAFGGLQNALLQRGAQDARLRSSPIAQQGVANQVGANILGNQVIPQGLPPQSQGIPVNTNSPRRGF